MVAPVRRLVIAPTARLSQAHLALIFSDAVTRSGEMWCSTSFQKSFHRTRGETRKRVRPPRGSVRALITVECLADSGPVINGEDSNLLSVR